MATGFVGGMIGLALGRPRLLLVYWTAKNPVDAAGTNILISSLAGITSTWAHFREGRIDFRILTLMGVPSFIGAFVGGVFGGLVPRAILLVIVGLMTTWYGFTLFTGRRGSSRRRVGPANPTDNDCSTSPDMSSQVNLSPHRRVLEIGLGFSIGLFGGVVGLMLGQLRLPAMIEILRMDARVAAGTNLAIGTATGLFGFLGHLLRLEIDFAVLIILGPAAMVGAHFGAKLTGKVSPQTLQRWMGAIMIVTSIPIFWLAYIQR